MSYRHSTEEWTGCALIVGLLPATWFIFWLGKLWFWPLRDTWMALPIICTMLVGAGVVWILSSTILLCVWHFFAERSRRGGTLVK